MTDTSFEMPRRYLAIWFPFLPSDRLEWQATGSHARAEAPLCFIEKQNNALRIVSVNRPAVRLRV